VPSPLSQPVVAAVLCRAGTVLLCRRPLAKRHGGLWEFPGGKVHEGESAREALARELDEELGLAIESAGEALTAIEDPGSSFTIAFHLVAASGTPRAIEHLEIAWVPLAAVARYPLAPSDRRFVESGGLASLRDLDPSLPGEGREGQG
jgi:mutator protein MutT